MRQRKKPTKAEMERQLERLRVRVLELELQKARLHRAWEKKFALLAGIFAAELEAAGTIGELRRWFAEWNRRLDAIDPEDPDADIKMQELFDKYDIHLQTNVSPDEMIAQEDRHERRT